MISTLHKMGVKSSLMYAAGMASIGASFASWLVSKNMEPAGIDRADRWGIYVGQWAPTFFALGVALRIEEAHDTSREEMEMQEPLMSDRTRTPAGL
ncbi:hypothetical protein [Nonomuraea dietziae]|uniref:Uncharacterized protein n=1 Tax=Nonomuraea dietziae TaxID=65515 RepID=A0A7W5V4Y2_9ACTN|nr:hypothetical protein [Nonomuraea dietziae]MBB3727430.1 hypothetical protein [Nonomuraea dietziae]